MKIRLTAVIAFAAIGAWTAIAALAATPAITWKSESVTLPNPGGYFRGQGANVLNQNCAMCHSAGFVNRQPLISRAAWTAEVKKMKGAFGAPIADANIPKIVTALEARHKGD